MISMGLELDSPGVGSYFSSVDLNRFNGLKNESHDVASSLIANENPISSC